MTTEIWKPIKNYEGLYEISNLGRVKRLAYTRIIPVNNRIQTMSFKDYILTPIKHRNGYYAISLSKNNIHKVFLIHRLVAEAFIPNPGNLLCVNHIDENKANNNVNNLEWCTHKENNNYGNHTKKIAQKLSKKVLCVETGVTYKSLAEVEKKLGIAHNSISKVCLRRKTYCRRISLEVC